MCVLFKESSVSSGTLPFKLVMPADSEGFFHTGDVGEFTSAGCLKVIDRLKNMFKLAQGKTTPLELLQFKGLCLLGIIMGPLQSKATSHVSSLHCVAVFCQLGMASKMVVAFL